MTELVYPGPGPALLRAYLLSAFPLLTPGGVARGIKGKAVRVNGQRAQYNQKLAPGDRVQLYLPPALLEQGQGPAYLGARGSFAPVFEDGALLIAQKPAGLLCQGEERDTLLARGQRYLYEKEGPAAADGLRLCHRLDAGTSGLLMMAKSEEAFQSVFAAMEARAVKKTYRCVVIGAPPAPAGKVEGYLTKNSGAGLVRPSEKPLNSASRFAKTRYRVLEQRGGLSLLEVELITGRTHQIRVHMAWIGCPILGDGKYGDNRRNRAAGLKYQALCARELAFPFPPGHWPLLDGVAGRTFRGEEPWFEAALRSGALEG